jgi:GGDEF domain-containing protein
LVDTAGILVRCISPDSIPARIGGDEFAVYVPATTGTQLKKQSRPCDRKLPDTMAAMICHCSYPWVLPRRRKELPLAELMATADKWMYREKLRQARTHRSSSRIR